MSGLLEAVESPIKLVPPLFLRLGGEDVHLVLRTVLVLGSVLEGKGSELKRVAVTLKGPGCDDASGSCSGLIVRGSGFTILHVLSVGFSSSLDSSSIASEVRMTRKCVSSEGVMVSVFGSALSFLLFCM